MVVSLTLTIVPAGLTSNQSALADSAPPTRAQVLNIEKIVHPAPTPSKSEQYELMLQKLHAAEAEDARIAAEKAAQEAAAKAAAEAAAEAQRQADEAARAKLAAAVSYGNNYAYGFCTWYVASRRSVPSNWGNANTWLANAQADGWSTGSVPKPGAIAQTTAGAMGHVAIVEAVYDSTILISEMNFDGGVGVVHQRVVPSYSFSYIY